MSFTPILHFVFFFRHDLRLFAVPFGFAVSPNHSLIASVSSSSMMPFATTATVIHSHPSKVSFVHDGGECIYTCTLTMETMFVPKGS